MLRVSLFIYILLANYTAGDIFPYFPEPSKEQTKEYGTQQSNENGVNKLLSYDYFRTDSKEDILSQLLSVVDRAGDIDEKELKQFKAEIEAGDMTRLTGSNWHLHQTDTYPTLGRRFVPQYPYSDGEKNNFNEEAEDNSLTPKLAPPELVLAVAKESAMLEAAKPPNPTEELIKKDILRTGKYWNAVWREDIDPKEGLRTNRKKLQSVYAKLSPGTEIYNVISRLQEAHPKLLYVINKKNYK